MSTQNGAKRSVKHLKQHAELYLPDANITATVKAPSLALMIAHGKLPDHLLSKLMEQSGESGEVAVSGVDMPGMMAFAIELAKETFIWPRIVDEADPDDDDTLEAGQLSIEDLSVLLSWAFSGAKGADIPTRSGAIGADKLETFRPDEQLQSVGSGSRAELSENV